MDMPTSEFVRAGSLAELKAGRGGRRSFTNPGDLDGASVFALDNRCPHMGTAEESTTAHAWPPAERADHSPLGFDLERIVPRSANGVGFAPI